MSGVRIERVLKCGWVSGLSVCLRWFWALEGSFFSFATSHSREEVENNRLSAMATQHTKSDPSGGLPWRAVAAASLSLSRLRETARRETCGGKEEEEEETYPPIGGDFTTTLEVISQRIERE